MNDTAINDWLHANAEFMAEDRPDLYTFDTARIELYKIYVSLAAVQESTFVSFSSYILSKFYMDGVGEYILSRKMSTFTSFDDDESYAVSHHVDIDLPGLDEDVLA